jgi:plasmid maintenance system antidote protein VapI
MEQDFSHTSSYYLRGDVVRELLNRNHYSSARMAHYLGISRAYWSQLLNRRRALTPNMRHLLLSCMVFKSVPEDQLWERVLR